MTFSALEKLLIVAFFKPIESAIEPEHTRLYEGLRKFRLETSRKENVKPYFIFSNAQLDELIKVNPKTLEKLQSISEFGPAKCEKYGACILEIILNNIK